MPAPTLDVLFAQLRSLLTPYARHFSVHEDTADTYDLEEELPHNRTQFAVLVKGKRDVRLYFYPLRVFPDLRFILPASLRSRIVSKSVLKLTSLTAAERARTKVLLAFAWQSIEMIRTLDPGRPYYKPFSVDETHGLLVALTKSRPEVTLTKRKRFVEVSMPPLRRAQPLRSLLPPPGPRRYKFSSITPSSYINLANVLGVRIRKAGRA